MLLWKTLFPETAPQQNSFRLAMCKWNYRMAITEAGRRRIFHRINIDHLFSISGTVLSPNTLPEIFEDCGISSDRYLDLFPHRMIHMGNLGMTTYEFNERPIIFSYSTDFLQKQSENMKYMNQSYYMEYCAYLSDITEEDRSQWEYIKKIRPQIFQDDRVTYQDQRGCEVVLPELDICWSNFVIVFSDNDALEIGKWLKENGLSIPVFNLGLSGLRHYAMELDVKRSECSVEKCRNASEGIVPLFETAMDVGVYEFISSPEECIFADE